MGILLSWFDGFDGFDYVYVYVYIYSYSYIYGYGYIFMFLWLISSSRHHLLVEYQHNCACIYVHIHFFLSCKQTYIHTSFCTYTSIIANVYSFVNLLICIVWFGIIILLQSYPNPFHTHTYTHTHIHTHTLMYKHNN